MSRDRYLDALSPAYEAIESFISQHLEDSGHSNLVARTWHRILHGDSPGPMSHMDWSPFDGNGPPSTAAPTAKPVDEPLPAPAHPVGRTQQARFICSALHLRPEAEVLLRFHP